MANNENDIQISGCDTAKNVACANVATSTEPLFQSVDATTNTYPVYQSDASVQNVVFTLDSDTQTAISTDDVCTQTEEVATAEASTETHKPDVQDMCTSTDDLEITKPSTEYSEDDDTEDSSFKMTPFTIESIQHDDKAVLFYTGFSSYAYLITCFNFLGPAVTTLNYHSKDSEKEPHFTGRRRALTSLNEFFLTLCRLRLGLREQDLSYRFKISQSTVSRIITTWINFLFHKFKEVPIWPSREVVDNFMPDCFRSMYPRTRCIIDATEIFIQMPSNPSAQQLTFSNYKNHNMLKVLVGITPSGAVCFISDLYGGNISDKKLTSECGFLKLLEPGDSIMADRGFNIQDILPPAVSLNVPPRLNELGQLTESERTITRRIASVRIHVERAIERIKNYQILHSIPNSMHSNVNQVFFVCAILTNFLPPLVQ